MVVYALIIPSDCIQLILKSGLKAIGMEEAGTAVQTFCSYFITIIMGYYLCYSTELRVYGLVIGSIVSSYVATLGLVGMYVKVEWTKQIEAMTGDFSYDTEKKSTDIGEDEKARALLSIL